MLRRYGATYRKRTTLWVSNHMLDSLAKKCNHRKRHDALSGWKDKKKPRKQIPTQLAKPYPRQLCRTWAKCVQTELNK